MTTVGYGDVYACSIFGRIISIMNALWGAFVISLLMGSIGTIFDLSNREKRAVAEITTSKQAAISLKTAVQYFNAVTDYKKNTELPPEQRTDYVYTREEVKELKQAMTDEADKLHQEKKHNDEMVPKENPAEKAAKIVKNQILDLNDKLDYMIMLMLKDQLLNEADGSFTMGGKAVGGEEEAKEVVKSFQVAANQNSVIESQTIKHPPPKPTFQQRLNSLRTMKEKRDEEGKEQ
eukprot:CAMPEP_0202956460 /NCGR_PEP_ID=MMETSP1396-20130829/962_1 /ASSEMBLY_ACC=CAM_ASM_000872 /TAXON_ID= /ORGANISM="Pseudokeronopsis sp., Strain Brazil" /LENGTH=233 /DNA_ID=CAMNT_0049673483 /DNA_START=955 /DNA_END=1656 /DNA_ORIENTATION=+